MVKTLWFRGCALRKFHVHDRWSKHASLRLRVIVGPNACDQSPFCALHTFLVKVQMNAGYIHANMHA